MNNETDTSLSREQYLQIRRFQWLNLLAIAALGVVVTARLSPENTLSVVGFVGVGLLSVVAFFAPQLVGAKGVLDRKP